MKIRISFVTNSSSANFTVSKKGLSAEQVALILDPTPLKAKFYNLFVWDGPESWTIINKEKEIELWTSMDNFDYQEIFDILNIPEKNISGGSDDE